MKRLPFQERKTPWRGVLDLMTGCYPAFTWGGPLGDILPVFHFHDVTRETLEPYLAYLAQNQYRTVTSEAMGRWVRDGMHPGERCVVLCFDDAWASMWTVVTPLLKAYDMSAITYVIPARVAEADTVRDPATWTAGEGEPLATWPEIEAMHASGHVDVQAHTLTHARLFCSDEVIGFVTPQTHMSLLGQPVLEFNTPPRVLGGDMLGAPLYLARSRMSDARAYVDTEPARRACIDYVTQHGGVACFENAAWRQELEEIASRFKGRFETTDERDKQQLNELVGARDRLQAKLPGHTIRQVCFPWGIVGRSGVEAARRVGYETGVADQMWGRRCIWWGSDPYHIMRLKHAFIFALPGQGRRRGILFGKGN